jgi:outer membrane protein assembly factor BamB
MVEEEPRILVGSHDDRLYCLDEEGRELWRLETDSYVNGAPAVDGAVAAFGGCDGLLHVVDVATGRERGFEVGSYVAGSAALAGGRAFVGHYGGKVVCLELEGGETVWEYGSGESPFFSTPAVDEKRVIVGGRDRLVHCLDRENGRRLWTFATRGEVDSSPVICGTRVVVGSADGRLYVLDLATGERVWSWEVGAEIVCSPAVARGHVVIGAQDGAVYAFTARLVPPVDAGGDGG